MHAAALQYVRKIAGTTKPSKADQDAFDHAVREIAHITQHLLDDLVAAAPPRSREAEAATARARLEPLRPRLTRPSAAPRSAPPFFIGMPRSLAPSQDGGANAPGPRPGDGARPG